jgi:DNA-binding IclR family transcriptional regulator
MKRNLVAQDRESGKYRLGIAVVRLGSQAERALDLRSIALPELQSLSRRVKEIVTLGALDHDRVVTVAWADGTRMSGDRTGRDQPLHSTAPGKVLLSHRPEREVIRLSKIGFTPYTDRTIVRLDVLLEELARVRARGFATAFGEHERTVNAVAVPVFDQRSAVVAALEVRAPGMRIPPSRVLELVARVRDTAAIITASLGGAVASE